MRLMRYNDTNDRYEKTNVHMPFATGQFPMFADSTTGGSDIVGSRGYVQYRHGMFEVISIERRYLGKLNGTLTAGGSATVSLWMGSDADPTPTDTGNDVTAYDWYLPTGDSLASGTKVKLELMENGRFYVTGAACVE
jgi:hypothetical protein